MTTEEHSIRIHELGAILDRSWGEEALLACLLRLQSGGLTEGVLVEVVDAWAGPGDTISVVYRPPWTPDVVGLRRSRASGNVYYSISGRELPDFTPVDFGESVADWDLGEPMGIRRESLWRDSAGIRWWGDI